VGIDNSMAMLERANHKLAWLNPTIVSPTSRNNKEISMSTSFRDARGHSPVNYTGHSVELLHEDVMNISLDNTSVVVLNYTLQFVPVAHRRELLQRIFDGLAPGGLLFLSEKVRAESAELHETCTWFYEAFKRARGYSHNEVARKRAALMDVLVPFSERELTQVLLDAGFQVCQVVLKWNNFSTFVALKAGASSENGDSVAVQTCGLPASAACSTRATTTTAAVAAAHRVETVVDEVSSPSASSAKASTASAVGDEAAARVESVAKSLSSPATSPTSFPNLRQIFDEKPSGPIAVLLDQAAVFASRREKALAARAQPGNNKSGKGNKTKKPSSVFHNTNSISTVQALTPPSTAQGVTPGVHEASAREILATLLRMERETFESLVLRNNSIKLEPAAELFLRCSHLSSKHVCVKDDSVLEIGQASELLECTSQSPNNLQDEGAENSDDISVLFPELLSAMKPWKKGPLCLFGVQIDTEWRSDWKWNRIADVIGDVSGCAVADLGSANGYFAFRLLQRQRDLALKDPSSVLCIDPNLKAWMEFQVLSRFADQHNKVLGFHLGDDSVFDVLPAASFDVMLCLGVLYHTHDPIGMLRRMWRSLRPGGTLVLDCQGLPELIDGGKWGDVAQGEEGSSVGGGAAVSLIPRGRYANAKGIWFLPSVAALENWLRRTNFEHVSCFFSEALSQEEQHGNADWASVSSLPEALDPNDPTKTIEGYPAPYRHYVKCKKPGKRLV
jgi:tRNA (mo5U34)-methyltransferase